MFDCFVIVDAIVAFVFGVHKQRFTSHQIQMDQN